MKFTEISEINIPSAILEFSLSLKDGKSNLTLYYTCPDCDGHGCSSHGGTTSNKKCSGGTIYKKIDPSNLDKVFEGQEQQIIADNVKHIFSKLLEK